jgi:hypothetical protein
MSRRHLWPPLAVLLAIFAYAMAKSSDRTAASQMAVANRLSAHSAVITSVTVAPAPAQRSIATTNTPQPTPLKEAIPTREILRAEVARDPHETPQALLSFSVDLQQRQVEAMKSEHAAQIIFKELEHCTADATSPSAVRALCLLDAKRLQTAYPSLASEYRQLEAAVDARTVGLIKDIRR